MSGVDLWTNNWVGGVKHITVHYDANRGSRRALNWYKALTVLFGLIAAFLAFVAWHNAKPFECDQTYVNESNQLMCVKNLGVINETDFNSVGSTGR